MMKTIFAVVSMLLMAVSSHAEVPTFWCQEYNIDFRSLLTIAGKLAKKQIVVDSEADLRHVTTLILPKPVPVETCRKVIASLLMLEGYELVENGESLDLHRVLSEEQCAALNEGIGRVRPEPVKSLPHRRVDSRQGPRGEQAMEWVVVRPESNKAVAPGPAAAAPK